MTKNNANLLLIVVIVLFFGYFLVQLINREKSAVYVDNKVKIGVMNNGCRTLLPYSFDYKGPGLYNIVGFGRVHLVDVLLIDLEYAEKHLIGPGGLPPKNDEPSQPATNLTPAGVVPVLDDARYFAQDALQGVEDVARVPLDFLSGQGNVRQDLRRVGQDFRDAPGRTLQFIEDEVRDVKDIVSSDTNPLLSLNL